MSKLLEMFQQDFMLSVLAGTVIVAAVCSYLGVFVVLRRSVFVGAALAQVSSLGVALTLFAGSWLGAGATGHSHLPSQPLALVLTVGAAVLMALQTRERRVTRETMIGVAYAGAAGLAILVVAVSAHGEAEVLNILFGNVLTLGGGDVVGLAVLAVLVGVVHLLFFKEFLFVSFDPDMARALGVRAGMWNMVLFLTIGVAIAIAIRAAGALVVFNFLVTPAAMALLWGRSLRAVFVIAMAVGVACSVTGIAVSYMADWPSGPTIVSVNVAVLLVAAVAGLSRRLR